MLLHIYTDGSSLGNPGPGGAAAIGYVGSCRIPVWTEQAYLGRNVTNNEAEYRAVELALNNALVADNAGYEITVVRIHTDSLLVMNQLEKIWKIKSHTLRPLWRSVGARLADLRKIVNVEFVHVNSHSGDPGNNLADDLAKAAARMCHK